MEANQFRDRFGTLERVVGAPEQVLRGLSATAYIAVPHDDAAFDRDVRQAGAGDSVTTGAGELPSASAGWTHIDGVNLAVALHRLTDCRRPRLVDRPQALTECDLVGVERNDVAGISRRKSRGGGHV
jgi:hypothetical protein